MGGNVETDWDSVLEDETPAPASDTADALVVPETETLPVAVPAVPVTDAPAPTF